MKELGSDWSRQKLLCYEVRAAVISTLSHLELIEERSTKEPTAGKALKGAMKHTRLAAQKVEELFRQICETEKGQ